MGAIFRTFFKKIGYDMNKFKSSVLLKKIFKDDVKRKIIDN